MKRIIFIAIAATFILASCSGKKDDPRAIRDQITKYHAEINKLNLKIKELEKQLENDSLNQAGVLSMMPVQVDTAKHQPFRHFFEVGGSIEAVEEAYISPELNGQIRSIFVKKGQAVQKGQVLARLNTDVTEASIREVETNLKLAKVMYEKQEELWKQNIGTELQYLQAKSNKETLEARLNTMKAQLSMAEVKAPFSGIVDEIFRKEGELAVPGMQLMRMLNLTELIVKADVSEAYLTMIKVGDSIGIEFPSYGKDRIYSRVTRMGNAISSVNRSFPVETRVRNSNGKYKPNSMAVLFINDYTSLNAISVPSIIVKQDVHKGFFLFVATQNEDGQIVASKRFIKTGKSYKGMTEVVSGLEEGDYVIVQGYNTISNGSPVRIVKS